MNETFCPPRRLILASASPRRHEILAAAGIPHEIRAAHADEALPAGITPDAAVEMLSARKAAAALAQAGENEIVLAADTVVSQSGRILGKPADEDDARNMLRALSGGSHTVYTGITVTDGVTSVTAHEETVVRMRTILPQEIEAYIASGDPMDKAGAYGYQSLAGIFVAGIEGDYFNVVGLPLCRTAAILRDRFGFVPLWQKR